MATALMNEKWWVVNKAKTLTDAGDTVKLALTAWDKIKVTGSSQNIKWDSVNQTLVNLKTKAEALKKKANSVLHKDTIGYLDLYFKNGLAFLAKLTAADGKDLLAACKAGNIPSPMIAAIKKIYPQFGEVLEENVKFLNTMKGGKGSQWVFDKFVKPGSKMQANLPATLQKDLAALTLQKKWVDPKWAAAYDEIKRQWAANVASHAASCAHTAKASVLETLKNQ